MAMVWGLAACGGSSTTGGIDAAVDAAAGGLGVGDAHLDAHPLDARSDGPTSDARAADGPGAGGSVDAPMVAEVDAPPDLPPTPDSSPAPTPDSPPAPTPDSPVVETPDSPVVETPDSPVVATPDSPPVTPDSPPPPPCGNGVLDPGESCDTAIVAGPGSCPKSCDDGMACTADMLVGTLCQAHCTHTDITAPANGDGCCPAGATSANDDDCPVPTAYRITSMDLADPHLIGKNLFNQMCTYDISALLGVYVDNQITNLIFNPVIVFKPLTQAGGATTPMELNLADCATSVSCSAGATGFPATATNGSGGECLGVLAGTESTPPYNNPTINKPSGACFSSDAQTIMLTIGGLDLTFYDARIAGVYTGTPATGITTGLLRGFLTEADADLITVPLFGGMLSSWLPGGSGNCSTKDDRDTGPGGQSGWYFYINFVATKVPYTE
jgi:hypothetical protein